MLLDRKKKKSPISRSLWERMLWKFSSSSVRGRLPSAPAESITSINNTQGFFSFVSLIYLNSLLLFIFQVYLRMSPQTSGFALFHTLPVTDSVLFPPSCPFLLILLPNELRPCPDKPVCLSLLPLSPALPSIRSSLWTSV